jgi:hypothetical protein
LNCDDAGGVLELALGFGELRPLELGKECVLSRSHEDFASFDLLQLAPLELGKTERARLAANEVDLPTGGHVDDVERRFVTVSVEGGFATDVELVFRQ